MVRVQMDSPGSQSLDKGMILKAFELLSERLGSEGVIGEIAVFGGIAMVLAFNARFSTKDVDAVFEPPEMFRRLASAIAQELNLSPDWLNDGVKGYLSGTPDYTSEGLPELPYLRIVRPTAEYLLAMKCMASRLPTYTSRGDLVDIKFLIRHLGLTTEGEVLKIVERYYPPGQILPRTQFVIQELMGEEGMEGGSKGA